MARNLLLTAKYAQVHGLTTAVDFVLAPQFDTSAARVVKQMQARLNEPSRNMARYRSLDDVVASAVQVLGETSTAEMLRRVPGPLSRSGSRGLRSERRTSDCWERA